MQRRDFLALCALAATVRPAVGEPGRLLVLGGTSFLGRAVVERALQVGLRVSLFHRGKTNPGLFPEAEHLIGDRNGQLQALEGRQFDWVIDTSGQRPSQVRASTALLQGARRYLYVSSISVYADKSTIGLKEDSPLVEPGPDEVLDREEQVTYGQRKVRCERLTREAFGERAIIVRPCLIVGPHDPTDRFTYWPVRFAAGGAIVCPGTPADPIQWVDVRDLADWMVRLCTSGARTQTNTFNGVGPARLTGMGALMDACQAAAGQDCQQRWVDAATLEKLEVSAWTDMPVWVPPQSESAGFVRIDNRAAVAAGLTFRPLAETVRDTLAWKRSEGLGPLKAGLSREKEASVLARS